MRETVKSDICTFIWTKFTKTIVRKLGDDRIEEVFPFMSFFLGGGGRSSWLPQGLWDRKVFVTPNF